MSIRSTSSVVLSARYRKTGCISYGHLNLAFCHNARELDEELLPSEWYRAAYAKLIRLNHTVAQVQLIDGRLINISDDSVVFDYHAIEQMQEFSLLAKFFIGSPTMQRALQKKCGRPCFSKASERNSMTLDSLTKVCNFLNISAQQRKNIRLTVCPQVTQHHIWRGALDEILINLKLDMELFKHRSPPFQMGKQIVSSCIKFLADATELSDSDTPSWMRPAPTKKVENSVPQRRWEEVLEMFLDLSKCLAPEERMATHVAKLEWMREGLYQIKDILVEKDISYKEARRQDCLVQRKLSKSLGHSSKCLFTLLLYYLYGSVRDLEVEVCGNVSSNKNGGKFSLNIGKILTCCDEKVVWNGVKQLSRVLGLYKFVWEMARQKEELELQGHLWCLGAEEKTIKYRGSLFFLHDISLRYESTETISLRYDSTETII